MTLVAKLILLREQLNSKMCPRCRLYFKKEKEEKSVSVAIEEVQKEDWAGKVYQPDILNNKNRLYKKPGYNPFEQK